MPYSVPREVVLRVFGVNPPLYALYTCSGIQTDISGEYQVEGKSSANNSWMNLLHTC